MKLRRRRSRCYSTCTPLGDVRHELPTGVTLKEGNEGTGVTNDRAQSEAQAAAAASSRDRLASLTTRILRDFAKLASGEGGALVSAQARDELNARAPLAVDALKALARFKDDLFAEKVSEVFPALTALVRCEHAPAEVSRVLGEVFTAKIGPLVVSSLADRHK